MDNPPTDADIVKIAMRIYEKEILGNNLDGKADETVRDIEDLRGKIVAAEQSVVSSGLATSGSSVYTWSKRGCNQRLDGLEELLRDHNGVLARRREGPETDWVLVGGCCASSSVRTCSHYFQDLRGQLEETTTSITLLEESLQTGMPGWP